MSEKTGWRKHIADFLRFVQHGKKPKPEPITRAQHEPKEITSLFFVLYACKNSHTWHTQTACPYCGDELEHRLVVREVRFDKTGLADDFNDIPVVRIEIKKSCNFIPEYLSVGIFDNLLVKAVD